MNTIIAMMAMANVPTEYVLVSSSTTTKHMEALICSDLNGTGSSVTFVPFLGTWLIYKQIQGVKENCPWNSKFTPPTDYCNTIYFAPSATCAVAQGNYGVVVRYDRETGDEIFRNDIPRPPFVLDARTRNRMTNTAQLSYQYDDSMVPFNALSWPKELS